MKSWVTHINQIPKKFYWLSLCLLLAQGSSVLALEEIEIPGVSGELRFQGETHSDSQFSQGNNYKSYLNLHSPDWRKEFTWELNMEHRNYWGSSQPGTVFRQEEDDKIDTGYIRWTPQSETKMVITAGRQTQSSDYLVNFDGIQVHSYPHKYVDIGVFGGRKVQHYVDFQEDNFFGGEIGFHFDAGDLRYLAKKDLDKIFHVFNMNLYPFENFTFLFREQVFDDRHEYFQLGFDYINPNWDFTIHDIFTQRNLAGSRVATVAGNDAFPANYPYGHSDEFLYKNDSYSNLFKMTKNFSGKFETGMEWELINDNDETNYWGQFFFSIYDLFTDGSQFNFEINKKSEELITNQDGLTAGFDYQFPFRLHWLFQFGYIQDVLDTTLDSYRWGRVFGSIQYKRNKNYLFRLRVNNHNGDIMYNGPVRNTAFSRNDNQMNFETVMKF